MSTKSADPNFAFAPDPDSPELSLEDTAARKRSELAAKPKAAASGYDPYESTARIRNGAPSKRKPTDLRKLSEWIKLQRQVEDLKKDGSEPKDES